MQTHKPQEPKEKPYVDEVIRTSLGNYKIARKYTYPGGRSALIERAIYWRGFTQEEAEKMYPENIT